MWYQLALLQADTGDREGYRKTCTDMLERFGQSTDPETVYFVARACAFLDGGPDDLRALVAAMQKVAAGGRKARYLSSLGHLLYRAGDVEGAVKVLNQALIAPEPGDEPWHWFALAAAHARLGHLDEARHWLNKGASLLDDRVGLPIPWTNRIHLNLMRREAADLIKKLEANTPKPK